MVVKKATLDNLVSSLNCLYKEAEELMTDTNNAEQLLQKQKLISDSIDEYRDVHFAFMKNAKRKNVKDNAKKELQSLERGKMEFDNRVEEWLSKSKPGSVRTASRAGSSRRSGTPSIASTRSSTKRTEAAVRKELAVLKKKQLAEKQKIQEDLEQRRLQEEQRRLQEEQRRLQEEQRLEMLEAEHELQAAEVEADIWEAHSSSGDVKSTIQVVKKVLPARADASPPPAAEEPPISDEEQAAVSPCRSCKRFDYSKAAEARQTSLSTTEVKPDLDKVVHKPQQVSDLMQVVSLLKHDVDLPKPDLLLFDGNPLDYTRFMSVFDEHIASRVTSDAAKLNYLIQFCTGEAARMIKFCSVLDAAEGYAKARKVLHDNFGRPYVVARTFVERLTQGPFLKSEDIDGLQRLARDLEECHVTLTQLGYFADINNLEHLLSITKRLPFTIQNRWKRHAGEMELKGKELQFCHLVEFVKYEASIADTMFARMLTSKKEAGQQKSVKPASKIVKASSHATTVATQGGTCTVCNANHKLESCSRFKQQNIGERIKVVRKAGLCFNCLERGHMSKDCKKQSACSTEGCGYKHHTLLHREMPKNDTGTEATRPGGDQNSQAAVTSTSCAARTSAPQQVNQRVYMNIVPVRVSGKNGREIETYAFVDSGSSSTMCTNRLLKLLGVTGESIEYSLSTINGRSQHNNGSVVSLAVKSLDRGDVVELPHVITVDNLPVSPNRCVGNWSHLQGIEFLKPVVDEVLLLIGLDVPEVFWIEDERRGRKGEPSAIKTVLGWSLFGPACANHNGGHGRGLCGVQHVQLNHVNVYENQLQEQVKAMWETDFKGASLGSGVGTSKEDRYALKLMEDSVQVVEGHYQLRLPWRVGSPNLPDNRNQAIQRLSYLKRRLHGDRSLCDSYKKTMESYITNGYAARVGTEKPEGGTVWYLPHHPVVHPQKPDKVRVVFDCAARYGGTSLNDQLLQGPDMLNSLFGTLIRFRQKSVAFVADVEAMFHQVKVDPVDTSALRFVWWPEGDMTRTPVDYKMVVHLFGATSSPSCASFCLSKTAEDNSTFFDEETVSTVKSNFYVDDCLKSVATEEQAIRLSGQLRELLQRGGFRLRKWLSNRENVVKSLPAEDRSTQSIAVDGGSTERVLGVIWNYKTDKFEVNVKVKDKPVTRRGILSVVSSLFDPLGFVAPVVLHAKGLLQCLCKDGYGWDEEAPLSVSKPWKKWIDELQLLSSITVERCFVPASKVKQGTLELHHFSDASSKGYGTVSYLRMVDALGNVHCSFVAGKARLAPLKSVSIPRLELTAATLAVKMDQVIRQEMELDVKRSVFWTDSTSVLLSIHNVTKRFCTFVANRLAKIDDGSKPSQWKYVPTEMNPADDASRGCAVKDFVNNQRWLCGPSFLYDDERTWPSSPVDVRHVPEEYLNNRKSASVLLVSEGAEDNCFLGRLVARYSSWYRLKKAIAYLQRFVVYTKSRKDPKGSKEITAADLDKAEAVLIKYMQQTKFSSEIQALTTEDDRRSKKKLASSSLRCLNPVIHDGVLRVGGRLSKAPIGFDTKHPIILPNSHAITDMIIRDFHGRVGHAGMSHTWTRLREKFWIVRGGAAVRRVLGKCMFCRRRNASVSRQMMADLPVERTTPGEPAFSSVGVDYFGPLFVKQGRSVVKRYGCIFTCMAVRAVHLEVSHSLSTDSFIDALRRFAGRRGMPKKIFSDNGTNFVGAERILRESLASWNQVQLRNELRQRGIEWNFNPPAASHMGGVWERLIRSVRKILHALLKDQIPSDETLSTLLVEVEFILNSRPLTPVTVDDVDSEPLTPNHLLLVGRRDITTPGVFVKTDNYVRKKWRQVQYLADQFWIRWTSEYLVTLQTRQKWRTPEENVGVGDVVLIVDSSVPRGKWLTGKVVETYPDKRGFVRSALVKTHVGTFKRPIAKLCLILKA